MTFRIIQNFLEAKSLKSKLKQLHPTGIVFNLDKGGRVGLEFKVSGKYFPNFIFSCLQSRLVLEIAAFLTLVPGLQKD
jgi:hypothetical protein